MVQDETEDDIDGAATEPGRGGGRHLLLAGVVCACALGAGLGFWARPALSDRGEKGIEAAEPLARPAPPRRLQIILDEQPAPSSNPLEVMASHPADTPPPRATTPYPAPRSSPQPPPPRPAGPPEGLRMADAGPDRSGPEADRPGSGRQVAALAARAEPLARGLISSAHAWLLKVAEVTRPPPSAETSTGSASPSPSPAPSDRTVDAASARRAERKAETAQRAAEVRARIEARQLAQAQAKLAQARKEAAEARAAHRREIEARKAERLAAEARAERLALARAERARRERAIATAKAEALADRRKHRRLAVLAHSAPKPKPHPVRRPEPPPRRPRSPSLQGSGSIRLASAPRCAVGDPGAALACADPVLVAADRRMKRAYREAEAAGVPESVLRQQQVRWLAARTAAAREAPWAVRDVYQARIAELEAEARSGQN